MGVQVINHYTAILNSSWEGKMKHAVSASQTCWLQRVGQEWIKTGQPLWKCCRELTKQLVGSEMVLLQRVMGPFVLYPPAKLSSLQVFLPINPSQNHWWLCVLYPAANEFQILDSFCRIDYEEQTRELVW